jgi:hypothetical protein
MQYTRCSIPFSMTEEIDSVFFFKLFVTGCWTMDQRHASPTGTDPV